MFCIQQHGYLRLTKITGSCMKGTYEAHKFRGLWSSGKQKLISERERKYISCDTTLLLYNSLLLPVIDYMEMLFVWQLHQRFKNCRTVHVKLSWAWYWHMTTNDNKGYVQEKSFILHSSDITVVHKYIIDGEAFALSVLCVGTSVTHAEELVWHTCLKNTTLKRLVTSDGKTMKLHCSACHL